MFKLGAGTIYRLAYIMMLIKLAVITLLAGMTAVI